MFIQHVYGVTIPCFRRLHILGVTSEVQSTFQKLMPPALNTRAFVIGTDVEQHAVTDIDPVQSFNVNKVYLQHANVFFSFSVGSVICVVCLAENLFQFTISELFQSRVLALGFDWCMEILVHAISAKPSCVNRAWCHPVEMTDGAHFARQRQRVYDLVLKSEVDDALVKTCPRRGRIAIP